jgi:hypothetical protein
MFRPKIFYDSYLRHYHAFKSILLKTALENFQKYEVDLFGEPLETEDSQAFCTTLKSDLRQNYFHAIETFFELFFTLIPNEQPNFDDLNILFNLTNSNWQVNYEKIKKIASGDMPLDFLSNKIDFHGYKITIGHYLFYYGLLDVKSIPDFFNKVSESIEAIKQGIKIIARDFTDRDEYNSYKHGLRIIPALSELKLVDPKTSEIKLEWNLKDSMSFFCKTKNEDEVKIKTKLFDSDRDFRLTRFCSNMISSIIDTRRVSFYNQKLVEKNEKIAIGFFGKKEIEICNKINVEIQDIVYTVKRK